MNLIPSSACLKIAEAVERANRHCTKVGEHLSTYKHGEPHALLPVYGEVIRFFEAERAASSVTYTAEIVMGDKVCPGYAEFTRDGRCLLSRAN